MVRRYFSIFIYNAAAVRQGGIFEMAAYVIAQLTITDPSGFEAYRKAAQDVVASFGGRFLVRGGDVATLEGDPGRDSAIVLEFPDLESAQRFYNSPEYKEIQPLRLNAASGSVVVVEGGV